jgi:hypothetical protein
MVENRIKLVELGALYMLTPNCPVESKGRTVAAARPFRKSDQPSGRSPLQERTLPDVRGLSRGVWLQLDGINNMPKVPAFHSINETKKPAHERVYHNNSACPSGRDIPANERVLNDGGYRLCHNCDRLNREGK